VTSIPMVPSGLSAWSYDARDGLIPIGGTSRFGVICGPVRCRVSTGSALQGVVPIAGLWREPSYRSPTKQF